MVIATGLLYSCGQDWGEMPLCATSNLDHRLGPVASATGRINRAENQRLEIYAAQDQGKFMFEKTAGGLRDVGGRGQSSAVRPIMGASAQGASVSAGRTAST